MRPNKANAASLAALILVAALGACATVPKSCRLLLQPLASDWSNESIDRSSTDGLICRAENGDRLAQLELGKRFETGRGVQVDLKKALKLYRFAAAAVPPRTAIYS